MFFNLKKTCSIFCLWKSIFPPLKNDLIFQNSLHTNGGTINLKQIPENKKNIWEKNIEKKNLAVNIGRFCVNFIMCGKSMPSNVETQENPFWFRLIHMFENQSKNGNFYHFYWIGNVELRSVPKQSKNWKYILFRSKGWFCPIFRSSV